MQIVTPLARYRGGLHWPVISGLWFVSVIPQLVGPVARAGQTNPMTWWPALCVLSVLTVAMTTDYLERPARTRVLIVLVGVLSYLVIMWPLMNLVGRLLGVDATSPVVARNGWAMLRTAAGLPHFVFATRATSLMARSE